MDEFVSIIATFHDLSSPEADLESRGYSAAQLAAVNKAKNVKTLTTIGVRFSGSLKRFACDSFAFYATLFGQYDNHGTLPFPGSLSEQPNYIIEVFNTLKALTVERQNKLNQQQEQQATKRKR